MTKITKKNVGAAIRDDKAHMDYLKRDINYDAKHGHSDINMTADEKHISKLAGDVRADGSFLSKHYTHNRVFSHSSPHEGGPEMFSHDWGGESVELKDQTSPAAMMESNPVLYVDGTPAYYMTPIKNTESEGEGEGGTDSSESSLNNPDNPNRKVASKMGQRGSLR